MDHSESARHWKSAARSPQRLASGRTTSLVEPEDRRPRGVPERARESRPGEDAVQGARWIGTTVLDEAPGIICKTVRCQQMAACCSTTDGWKEFVAIPTAKKRPGTRGRTQRPCRATVKRTAGDAAPKIAKWELMEMFEDPY